MSIKKRKYLAAEREEKAALTLIYACFDLYYIYSVLPFKYHLYR